MKYPKINTLFNRDEKNRIIQNQFSELEFDILRDINWECTEKIDGTNIRVEFNLGLNQLEIKGRTDVAKIPQHLNLKLKELFQYEILHKIFWREGKEQPNITIFGEGYGFKIQNGGNYIKNNVNFILFDININGYWLQREALEDIARELNIEIVPLIGYMTLEEAIKYVQKGFKSTIAENKDYDAEGLVLKTPLGLLNRGGGRIITKLKTADFRHLK